MASTTLATEQNEATGGETEPNGRERRENGLHERTYMHAMDANEQLNSGCRHGSAAAGDGMKNGMHTRDKPALSIVKVPSTVRKC